MAEPPQTSIDAPPFFPSSSAPSTPPDSSEESAPRLKSPWSQIVRGSPTSSRSKLAEASSSDQHRDEHAEKLHQQVPSSELRVSDRSTTIRTTSITSSSVDRRQGAHESHSEALTISPDGSVSQSGFFDRKPSQQSPAKSPKVAWGKLVSNPLQSSEPEPVMGAVAWPALSEARNPKALDAFKAGAVQKSSPKAGQPLNERNRLQVSPLLQRETGAMEHHEVSSQTTVNGYDQPNSTVYETPFPLKAVQGADADQSKWSGGKDPKVGTGSEGSPMPMRGGLTSHVNSKDSSRNFLWEQGRGNHSFPAYGRGNANPRENPLPVHQQRGGQRNVPQPLMQYANPTPGFVYPTGYQAVGGVEVPGNVYYMAPPTTDPILGATYFVQPGVFIPAPDILAKQGMVLKQIEYYFSVENLCRDIYLRSKMDQWGFVPVSVIANFNRVRRITQNPYLIIEALQVSNVVEVQGDKVRKKGDWANWLLPSGQPSAAPSGGKDQIPRFSTYLKQPDIDHFKCDNSGLIIADNDSNDHSDLVSQVGDQVEALSVTAVNIQSGNQDSLLHEEAGGSLSDGGLDDSQIDNVNSEHSTQPWNVDSGAGIK